MSKEGFKYTIEAFEDTLRRERVSTCIAKNQRERDIWIAHYCDQMVLGSISRVVVSDDISKQIEITKTAFIQAGSWKEMVVNVFGE